MTNKICRKCKKTIEPGEKTQPSFFGYSETCLDCMDNILEDEKDRIRAAEDEPVMGEEFNDE